MKHGELLQRCERISRYAIRLGHGKRINTHLRFKNRTMLPEKKKGSAAGCEVVSQSQLKFFAMDQRQKLFSSSERLGALVKTQKLVSALSKVSRRLIGPRKIREKSNTVECIGSTIRFQDPINMIQCTVEVPIVTTPA